MSLSSSAYTVGANQPMNRARILYAPIAGVVSASGTNGDHAATDFTFQKWAAAAGRAVWTMTAVSAVALDTVFVAAHNLAGKSIRAQIGAVSRTNLLLRNTDFSHAIWTKSAATVSANAAAAPDGTLTADLLLDDGTLSGHSVLQVIAIEAASEIAASIYVKDAGLARGRLQAITGADAFGINFDLGAGTVTALAGSGSGEVTDTLIENLGGGWFRVGFKGYLNAVDTSTTIKLNLADSLGTISYAGVGSGLYLWGAQAEQRVNLVTAPNAFDDAAWTKNDCSITANAVNGPDGTLTADKLVENALTAIHRVQRAVTIAAGARVEWSVFVSAAERSKGALQILAGDGDSIIGDFDLVAGTITTAQVGAKFADLDASIVDVLGGWFRVMLTGRSVSTNTSLTPRINPRNAAGASSYLGDGVSGFYIWGARFTQGAAITSLIYTDAATVTSDFYAVSPWVALADASTVAIMTNDPDGQPWQTTKYQIEIPDGTGAEIGIIRAGEALQMPLPVLAGVRPIGLSRAVEARHAISETGQWLSVAIQRQAAPSQMDWDHLDDAWYEANFHPFALSLPQTPFGLIQNPLRMPTSVAWCWTSAAPVPEYMGALNLLQVSLPVTGFLG